jgi:hypothetical protein
MLVTFHLQVPLHMKCTGVLMRVLFKFHMPCHYDSLVKAMKDECKLVFFCTAAILYCRIFKSIASTCED